MKLFCLLLTIPLVAGDGSYTGPALQSNTRVEDGVDIMFARPECFEFLLQTERGVQSTTSCGGRTCSFPNQLCFMDMVGDNFEAAETEQYSCETVPSCCLDAARNTKINGVSEARPCGAGSPGASGPAPRTSAPRRTPRPRATPAPSSGSGNCNTKMKKRGCRGKRFYFYDQRNKRCRAASGCALSANNFNTASSCRSKCMSSSSSSSSSNTCSNLPAIRPNRKGACRRKILFYFNLRAKRCSKTRGCAPSGHKNSFKSMSACRSQCKRR